MVQIIPFYEPSVAEGVNSFISHMVQIIRRNLAPCYSDRNHFISHMVQIIPALYSTLVEPFISLYIPHGSDNTSFP